MGYKFDAKKYMTRGVNESIPLRLQGFLWRLIQEKMDQGVELDYLQIFKITKEKDHIKVIHEQEQPLAFKIEYIIFDLDMDEIDFKEMKLYVMDQIEYLMMLKADEY